MKYLDWKSFEKHIQNASSVHLSSIYLLLGKEEFLSHLAEELVISAFKRQGYTLLNWDGSQVAEASLEQTLFGMDFFASSTLVKLTAADKLAKKNQELLQSYYPKAQSKTAILLMAPALNANTNFYKQTEKYGVVFAPEALKPKNLEALCVEWLIQQAAKEQKQLLPSAADLLYRSVGANYVALRNELNKLIVFIGNEKAIQDSHVSALVGATPQATTWQMSEAILQGNSREAFHLAHELLRQGNSLIGLIRQLRRSIQTGFEICSILTAGLPPQEISTRYPYMKGFILDKNIQLARQYGLERFHNAIIALDSAEFSAKDSLSDEELLIEQLVTKLIYGVPTPINK